MYEKDKSIYHSCLLFCSKPPNVHKSCGESIFQTNLAYGIDITNPATETGTSAEFSLVNHTEHDSQDMAVDVVPNEAYGAISANTQMPVCSTNKGWGESVYQTNVAYGITKPARETGTSAEFSLTNHTEHDPQDMAVDVAPNEAYGVTPAGAQMSVCTTNKGCASKHKVCSSALTNTSLHENDGTEYEQQP